MIHETQIITRYFIENDFIELSFLDITFLSLENDIRIISEKFKASTIISF